MGIIVSRTPMIVGHRANSGRVIQLYKLAGARFVEIDIRQDGDKILVGHGKPIINRATLIGKAWAWLDYKLFYRDPFLRVHTLHEWLDIISQKLDIDGVLLDVKNNVDPVRLSKELDTSRFDGVFYLSSEDHRIIPALREKVNGVTLASYSIMPIDIIKCTLMCNAQGVTLRKDYISKEIVDNLHSAGLIVFTWTINSEREAIRAAESRVDAIITDRPDIIKKALHNIR